MRYLAALLALAALVSALAFEPSAALAKKDPEQAAQEQLRKAAARETKQIVRAATKRIRGRAKVASRAILSLAKAVKKGKGLPSAGPGKTGLVEPTLTEEQGELVAVELRDIFTTFDADVVGDVVLAFDELRDAPNASQLLFDATQPDGQINGGRLLTTTLLDLGAEVAGNRSDLFARSTRVLVNAMDDAGRPLTVVSQATPPLLDPGTVATGTTIFPQTVPLEVISYGANIYVVVATGLEDPEPDFSLALLDADGQTLDSVPLASEAPAFSVTFETDLGGHQLVTLRAGPVLNDVVLPASELSLQTATSTVAVGGGGVGSTVDLALDGSPIQNVVLDEATFSTRNGRFEDLYVVAVDADSGENILVFDFRELSGTTISPGQRLERNHPKQLSDDHFISVTLTPDGSSGPLLLTSGASLSTFFVEFAGNPADGPVDIQIGGTILLNESGGASDQPLLLDIQLKKEDLREDS